MRRLSLLALLLGLGGVTAVSAQDVLTIGAGSAPSGGAASIPVSIRDRSGTTLGSDAGTGNRIQGFAFKILFPTEVVASVTFARAGVTAALTPMFETALTGDGWSAYIVSFNESSNAIPLTSNGLAPGDLVGTLTVTLQPAAVVGDTATLRFDAPGAMFSNQSSTVRETVALGNLALVNGSVTATLAAPTGVVATATTTSNVNVTWNAVANADHYQVWRKVDSGAFFFVNTTNVPSFSDAVVLPGKTYLYRVHTIDSENGVSPPSSIDAATTILFTDDPLISQSTLVKSEHLTQLRAAVNAFRTTASLASLPSDPTVAIGAVVSTVHITDLRTGLDDARSAVGLPAITYTDSTLTTGLTPIKALHVQDLRNGVK